MLYFAYGSNLWRLQMQSRCPGQREIGPGRLDGWRWIITERGYASIIDSAADYVLGTVYELTAADEKSLDRVEGVEQGLYYKKLVTVRMDEREVICMVYIDPVVREGRPQEEYISRINHGIQDAGLPEEYVTRCLRQYIPSTSP